MSSTNFQYLSQAFESDNDEELEFSTTLRKKAEKKTFLDPIHGMIEVHPLCIKIIDTNEFQRMRDIQQLGGASFVFHGATHNRFQHSLGVYYLAKLYMEKLQKNQPELHISDKDILMVSIAGLCHDLGHGIKSHLYDGEFLKICRKGRGWSHEIMSYRILDLIIKKYDLMDEFHNYDLYEDDIHCIYEMIFGCKKEAPENWNWHGMPGREFMYQIVANKKNGIDVDKFDYYKRDAYYLGLPCPLIIDRVIQAAKVVQRRNKEYDICFLDKAVYDIYEFFHARMSLHKRVYQHKVCKSIERMIVEMLYEAEEGGFVIPFKGMNYKLSDLYLYPEVYVTVTDYVLHDIMNSPLTNAHMEKAKALLNRVYQRDLYKCAGELLIEKEELENPEFLSDCTKKLLSICNRTSHEIDEEDIYTQIVYIDYGMKKDNPVDNVFFFPKNKSSYSRPITRNQVSNMLPSQYIDTLLRAYTRNPSKYQILKEAFEEFSSYREALDPDTAIPTPTKRRRLEL